MDEQQPTLLLPIRASSAVPILGSQQKTKQIQHLQRSSYTPESIDCYAATVGLDVCLPDPGHEILRPKPRRFDILFIIIKFKLFL